MRSLSRLIFFKYYKQKNIILVGAPTGGARVMAPWRLDSLNPALGLLACLSEGRFITALTSHRVQCCS